MGSRPTVWSVGHSNHSAGKLLELLRAEEIAYVIDVRSYPYSRHAPQFNREQLRPTLEAHGIGYVFKGIELGGRPQQAEHLDSDGHALYDQMAKLPEFLGAIERLVLAASRHRLALLCSCGRPDECHRRLLIGRVLCDRGVQLAHILPDWGVMSERSVALPHDLARPRLFGDDVPAWRSTRSVSRRARLSTFSRG
jgi:uncharacterized protein (DUF488 family)